MVEYVPFYNTQARVEGNTPVNISRTGLQAQIDSGYVVPYQGGYAVRDALERSGAVPRPLDQPRTPIYGFNQSGQIMQTGNAPTSGLQGLIDQGQIQKFGTGYYSSSQMPGGVQYIPGQKGAQAYALPKVLYDQAAAQMGAGADPASIAARARQLSRTNSALPGGANLPFPTNEQLVNQSQKYIDAQRASKFRPGKFISRLAGGITAAGLGGAALGLFGAPVQFGATGLPTSEALLATPGGFGTAGFGGGGGGGGGILSGIQNIYSKIKPFKDAFSVANTVRQLFSSPEGPQLNTYVSDARPYAQFGEQNIALDTPQVQNALFGDLQEPYSPQRPEAITEPGSLGELKGLTPLQQRTGLATRGVNVGLGSQENAYYKNLLQRSLIGEGNMVNEDQQDFLRPIESQYFSQQGMPTGDIMDFLRSIRG